MQPGSVETAMESASPAAQGTPIPSRWSGATGFRGGL